ncbi:Good for full DBP5 activity 2-like protein [Cladobotryum mycophilum]|uniref:Good for full DBP5 activity 2-like protein n=1 Tax=Cladobotryum mycophilum TaxID=491253 RepID=A0ABR0SCU8_9HYPO
MPVPDFASRLEMLKANFGVGFRVAEPEPEEDKEEFMIYSEDERDAGLVESANEDATNDVALEAPEQPVKTAPRTVVEESPFIPPFDCSNFQVGESLEDNIDFCSWKIVQSYPEHFIGKANKPRAQPFFDKILEGRVWDFFYLYHPEKTTEEPQLLVPSLQLEAFLRAINRELGTSLAIPGGVNQDNFYMKFGQGGTPRPRYLMRSRDQKTLVVESWPDIDENDVEAFKWATAPLQVEWKAKWRLMVPRSPSKDKKKNAELRAAKRKEDCERMLDEAQRFLHLKGDYERDVVLICMDVEAIERPPNPISEVGIAILDTKRIRGIPAGPSGKDWWRFIESHHLRTKEYSGLVNNIYVRGCPADFDFGTSTFPSVGDVGAEIRFILAPYTDEGRELIFVGHDASADVRYLSRVGFDVLSLNNLLGQLDTQTIHQAWRGLDSGRGLEAVLADLAIPSKHLHNAGNDAVYTLRALLGVVIEQIREMEVKAKGEEYVPALYVEKTAAAGESEKDVSE